MKKIKSILTLAFSPIAAGFLAGILSQSVASLYLNGIVQGTWPLIAGFLVNAGFVTAAIVYHQSGGHFNNRHFK